MKYLLLLIIFCSLKVSGQKIIKLTSGTKSNIRGMSVVNNKIIWVSGNNGIVGKSLNGGKTWNWKCVPNFENADFRDIEAFDENIALIMCVGQPGYILRTEDGGNTWKEVYFNNKPGIFLDAIKFWNNKTGIALGDPINNKFIIAKTSNGGKTWNDIVGEPYPEASNGEACFAASSTNLRTFEDKYYFVTGGFVSNLFVGNKSIILPILQGKKSTGANSIAIKNKNTFYVVGGDFDYPGSKIKNCCYSNDGGKTWLVPQIPPNGYRSCIEYIDGKSWITCGYNGVDYSNDDGYTWRSISLQSFNVCRKSSHGNKVYLGGMNGIIGKLER